MKGFRIVILLLCAVFLYTGCATINFQRRYELAVDNEYQTPRKSLMRYHDLFQITDDPARKSELLYRIGRIYLYLNDMDEAISHFQKLLDLPGDRDWQRMAKIELIALDKEISIEDKRSGIDELRSTTTIEIGLARANYHIGETYYQAENYLEALKYFKTASTFRKDTLFIHDYWLKCGICKFKMRKFANAEQDLKKAAISEQHFLNAQLWLSQLYLLDEKFQKALQTIDLIIDSKKLQERDYMLLRQQIITLMDTIGSRQIFETTTSKEIHYIIQIEDVLNAMERGEFDVAKLNLDNMIYRFPAHDSKIQHLLSEIEQEESIHRDRIGLIAPLSGPLATIGQSLYQGAKLAIEDFRLTHPEIPLELIIRDNQGKLDETLNAYQSLVNEEHVIAIIGPLRTDSVNCLVDISKEYRTVIITPGCPSNDVVNNSPYLFRLFPSPKLEAYKIIKFIDMIYDYHRFAIIFPQMNYGREALNGFRQAISEIEAEIVYEKSYSPTTTTYAQTLDGLDDINPDIILIPDQANRAAQLAGQIRYKEVLEPLIVGTGAWEDQILIDIAGKHLHDSIFISEYPSLYGKRVSLIDIYNSRYGERPDQFALRTYEATHLICHAILSGVKYRPQLQYHLTKNEALPGLDGPSSFNESGNYVSPLTIYQILEGRFEPIAVWSEDSLDYIVFDDLGEDDSSEDSNWSKDNSEASSVSPIISSNSSSGFSPDN